MQDFLRQIDVPLIFSILPAVMDLTSCWFSPPLHHHIYIVIITLKQCDVTFSDSGVEWDFVALKNVPWLVQHCL